MSNNSPSQPPSSATGATGNLRAYLIGGLVGAVAVFLCVVVFSALSGGFYFLNQSNGLARATGGATQQALASSTPSPAATLAPTDTPLPPATTLAPTDTPLPPPPPLAPTPRPLPPLPAFAPAGAPLPLAVSATPAPQPTAGQLVAATPTAASGWPVVFSDTFTSNANGWNITGEQPTTDQYGTFIERIGAGKLHVEAKAAQSLSDRKWPEMPALSDLNVTVQAQRVSGPTTAPYGLLFRQDIDGNCYIFLISDNQYFSLWLYQSQWTALINWTASTAIQPGAVNQLTVDAQGSQFTFFINNQQVGIVNDTHLPSGQAGVAMELFNAGDQGVFEFSNFVVRAPATAFQPSPTSANVTQATPTGQAQLTTPVSSGQWPVVFSDTFTSNANGWNITDQPTTNQGGTASERIGAGKLHVEVKAAQGVVLKFWPKMPALSDFNLTVQAQQLGGPANPPYGVAFRIDSNGNYYLFVISETQQFGVWLYQGQWTTLINWTKSTAIQPGAVNQLTVDTQGSQFTFFINNQQVGTFNDTHIPSGQAGVAMELFNPGDQGVFEFSNFVVRGPGAGVISSPTAQSSQSNPQNWPVVFSDNFASNASSWSIASQPYTNDFGTFNESISGGTFRLQLNATKGFVTKYWPKSVTASDLDLTVDARLTSGPATAHYGLVFRKDSHDDYYFFEIGDDKSFFVSLYNQGQWTNFIKGAGSGAIQPGAVNHLAVIAQGSHCSFFVNNQQIGTVDNNQVGSGQVGVGVDLNAGDQATVEFSNFVLRAP